MCAIRTAACAVDSAARSPASIALTWADVRPAIWSVSSAGPGRRQGFDLGGSETGNLVGVQGLDLIACQGADLGRRQGWNLIGCEAGDVSGVQRSDLGGCERGKVVSVRNQDRDLCGRQRGEVAHLYRPDLGGRQTRKPGVGEVLYLIARQGRDLGGSQGCDLVGQESFAVVNL